LLEALGNTTQAAYDKSAALRTAHIFRPAMVLLDIDTPTIGGYELAGSLLEQQREARPMLVAMTGLAQEADRQRAQDTGFESDLLKPVTREA
jgi:CheY-like chemotaxis protein